MDKRQLIFVAVMEALKALDICYSERIPHRIEIGVYIELIFTSRQVVMWKFINTSSTATGPPRQWILHGETLYGGKDICDPEYNPQRIVDIIILKTKQIIKECGYGATS
jgi:hypothetical protein